MFNPYELSQPTPAQKIVRAERASLDPSWVEEAFSKINLLVLEGDAPVLAEHVSRLAGARTILDDSSSRPIRDDSGARIAT